MKPAVIKKNCLWLVYQQKTELHLFSQIFQFVDKNKSFLKILNSPTYFAILIGALGI